MVVVLLLLLMASAAVAADLLMLPVAVVPTLFFRLIFLPHMLLMWVCLRSPGLLLSARMCS